MEWHDILAKMAWPELLLNIFASLIVAAATAALTIYFGLKHFYAEKWWERKSEAYFAIIEILHTVRTYTDSKYTQTLLTRAPKATEQQELNARLQAASSELRREIDLGSLIISAEGVSVTHKLMAELDASIKTNNMSDHFRLKLAEIDDCLFNLRRIARQDLTHR